MPKERGFYTLGDLENDPTLESLFVTCANLIIEGNGKLVLIKEDNREIKCFEVNEEKILFHSILAYYEQKMKREGSMPSEFQRFSDIVHGFLEFDTIIEGILDGTAVTCKLDGDGRTGLRVDKVKAPGCDVFEYYLKKLTIENFNFELAKDFSEKVRKLLGFSKNSSVSYIMKEWVETYVQEPHLILTKDTSTWKRTLLLREDTQPESIPEDYFKYACYVAVSHAKFGADHDSITVNVIFDSLTLLGCDLPAQIKKHGSGDVPKDVLTYKSTTLTANANDAFATIRITVKEDSETTYHELFDYLLRLFDHDFPNSYALEFRSPNKIYLPVKGLPKKGINQLFANAINYPSIHEKIEKYARAVMKEFEWYNNLHEEHSAMPGTFAVFALGLANEKYTPLVIDYLTICDGEHSGIQGKFMPAFIEKFGFTASTTEAFVICAGNIQELPYHKIYQEASHNQESLHILLRQKDKVDDYDWRSILYAIFGLKNLANNGATVIKKASKELQDLFKQLFV